MKELVKCFKDAGSKVIEVHGRISLTMKLISEKLQTNKNLKNYGTCVSKNYLRVRENGFEILWSSW